MKSLLLLFLIIVFIFPAKKLQAQTNTFPSTGSAGIGTTTPNASSLLEIKSTTQGLLIPRMTKAQRDAIGSPTAGLMVYQTNSTPGFYYFDGSAWTAIAPKNANKTLSNLSSPTALNVDLLPDSSAKRNIGAATAVWNTVYFHGKWYQDSTPILNSNASSLFFGRNAGLKNVAQFNTAFGIESLSSVRTGQFNSAVGYYALNSDSTGSENTALGYQALNSNKTGGDNTAIGADALTDNTSGFVNTAIGSGSLFSNTTGYDNVASGYVSLRANISGYRNIATGNHSLYLNTTGYDNVASGDAALYSNQDGSNNAALGNNALHENVSGIYNTAAGYNALYSNDGFRNTGIGNQALYSNTGGTGNTAVGDGAGYNVKTGTNNTFLGEGTNCGSLGTLTNSTALGNGATVTADNTFVLGNASVVGWGFGVGPGGRAIKVGNSASNGNGAYLTVGGTWTSTSARNKKEDFQKQDKNLILEKINQLEVTKWKYKGTGNEYHYGPMADDFHRLFAVGDDSSTSDMDKTGVLFLGMQQLIKMNEEKDAVIQQQNNKIDDLENRLAKMEAIMNGQQLPATSYKQQTTNIADASLEQNIPNPFNHTTTINYTLPQQYSSAKIIITDKNGIMLKQINLPAGSQGLSGSKSSVNVDASTLSSGAYQYSLFVDSKLISTKQMILSK